MAEQDKAGACKHGISDDFCEACYREDQDATLPELLTDEEASLVIGAIPLQALSAEQDKVERNGLRIAELDGSENERMDEHKFISELAPPEAMNTNGLSEKTESGREIASKKALQLFITSSGWLRNLLEANPKATCGCGSCTLCAYRHFESLSPRADAANRLAEHAMLDRYTLAEAIAAVAQKAGIYNGDVPLTTPDLMLLCANLSDLIEQLRVNQSVHFEALQKALKFCQELAEEELTFAKVGTGAEVALRHIARRSYEVLARIKGEQE